MLWEVKYLSRITRTLRGRLKQLHNNFTGPKLEPQPSNEAVALQKQTVIWHDVLKEPVVFKSLTTGKDYYSDALKVVNSTIYTPEEIQALEEFSEAWIRRATIEAEAVQRLQADYHILETQNAALRIEIKRLKDMIYQANRQAENYRAGYQRIKAQNEARKGE